MTTTDSDWPEDPNPLTPEVPGGYREFADGKSRDELVKAANEATARAQQAAWAIRQRDFFNWLAQKERVWFG